MCHHLVEGLADGLDMYYGTRETWFEPTVAAQPRGFCRVAATANPYWRRRRGLDAVDALWRMAGHGLRLSGLDEAAERARLALAESASRASAWSVAGPTVTGSPPGGWILEELAKVVAESGRLNRQTTRI